MEVIVVLSGLKEYICTLLFFIILNVSSKCLVDRFVGIACFVF